MDKEKGLIEPKPKRSTVKNFGITLMQIANINRPISMVATDLQPLDAASILHKPLVSKLDILEMDIQPEVVPPRPHRSHFPCAPSCTPSPIHSCMQPQTEVESATLIDVIRTAALPASALGCNVLTTVARELRVVCR